MALHSRILAWKIPCTEEPGGLQSMRLQRVRCNWTHIHYSKNIGYFKNYFYKYCNSKTLEKPSIRKKKKSVQGDYGDQENPGFFCSAWWHARQDRQKELNCFGDGGGGSGMCVQNYNEKHSQNNTRKILLKFYSYLSTINPEYLMVSWLSGSPDWNSSSKSHRFSITPFPTL